MCVRAGARGLRESDWGGSARSHPAPAQTLAKLAQFSSSLRKTTRAARTGGGGADSGGGGERSRGRNVEGVEAGSDEDEEAEKDGSWMSTKLKFTRHIDVRGRAGDAKRAAPR